MELMDVCRTCLSINAVKDIIHLPTDLEESKTCYDILLFCLNIKVTPESDISTTLCEKCYSKIILFYKFKTLAIKNDNYLKSQCKISLDNKEEFECYDVKSEEFCSNNNSPINFDIGIVKHEFYTKEDPVEYQSDDEILSVLQKIKYENLSEETKENVSSTLCQVPDTTKKKKKRNKLLKDLGKAKHICDICGKSVINIKNHMNLHKSQKPKTKIIQCKWCEKTFSSSSARYKHNKIKHLGIKQHCDECNKDVVSLKTHKKVVHDPASLPYKCVLCERRFLSKSSLEEHNNMHTLNRPYKCDVCEKSFRLKMIMLQHKRQVHDKEKSHLCQICSKTFFKKYHLQVHLRSHSKEKPYKCNECDKCFSSCTTLRNHKLIHSDVKAFTCNLCGMKFIRSGYLRNHMISHTRERNYPCKYCGVKFGRSDHRLRHQRTAHEQPLLSVVNKIKVGDK